MQSQLDKLQEEVEGIRSSVEEMREALSKLSTDGREERESENDPGNGKKGRHWKEKGRKQKERERHLKEREENDGGGVEAVFANLVPVGEQLLKDFLQSDLGRDIIEVSKGAAKRMVLGLLKKIKSKARGVVKNLAEGILNDVLNGKGVVINSLKAMIEASKGAVKKMAKGILDQVLTGKSGRKGKTRKKKQH